MLFFSYRAAVLAVTTCLLLISLDARAQTGQHYPDSPIHIVVPYSAGAGVDILTRIIGNKLSERLGQPIIVDNRPGASGNIGIIDVLRSKPDGYKFVMVVNTFVTSQALKPGAYDPLVDFAPVGLVGRNGMVLVANSSVKARSVSELIALAKANPGKLTYASVGPGSPQHLSLELFKNTFDVDIRHIPYTGAAGANLAVIKGEVDVMFMPVNVALGPIKAGQIVPLAVGTVKGLVELPNVLPLAKLGAPNFESSVWYALLAPAGTPQTITDQVYKEIAGILMESDVVQKLAKLGIYPDPLPAPEFKTFVKRELGRWQTLVREANIH